MDLLKSALGIGQSALDWVKKKAQNSIANWAQNNRQAAERIISFEPTKKKIASAPKNFITRTIPTYAKKIVEPGKKFGERLGEAVNAPFEANRIKSMADTDASEATKFTNTAIKLQKQGKGTLAQQMYERARQISENSSKTAQDFVDRTEIKKRELVKAGVDTGKTILGANYAFKNPALLGISGILTGLVKKAQGGSFYEGAGEGAAQATRDSAVLQATNPFIAGLTGKMKSLVGNPLAKQIIGRTLSGLGNVGENEILAQIDLNKPTSSDRFQSFIIGAVMSSGGDIKDWTELKTGTRKTIIAGGRKLGLDVRPAGDVWVLNPKSPYRNMPTFLYEATKKLELGNRKGFVDFEEMGKIVNPEGEVSLPKGKKEVPTIDQLLKGDQQSAPSDVRSPLKNSITYGKEHKLSLDDALKIAESQEDAVTKATKAIDDKLNAIYGKSKTDKDVINNLKGLRAAINKKMYEIAGVDPKAGKGEVKIFDEAFKNPEISGILSTLDGYKNQIDEIMKNPSDAPKIEAMDEITALKSAKQGKGEYLPGEVYEQNLGKLGVRQVLIKGRDAEGNVLGWYLPDKKSAQLLGQVEGFLQEAKFKPDPTQDRFPLSPSKTSTEKIKQAIDFLFFNKQKEGALEAPKTSNVPDYLKGTAEDMVRSSGKKAGNIDDETYLFIDEWKNADDGMEKTFINSPPSDNVVKRLSEYKPKEPITLYRGIREGQSMGTKTGYESWTKSKKVAEGFGKVESRVFQPDEILVDFDKLPKWMEDINGNVEKEVIVKTTPAGTVQPEVKPPTPESTTQLSKTNQTDILPTKPDGEIIPGKQQEPLVPLNKVEPEVVKQEAGSQPPPELPPPPKSPSGEAGMDKSGKTWLSSLTEKLHTVYTRTTDRFHPLTEIAKKTGDKSDLKKMQWAITGHYGAGSTATYHVNHELAPILKSVDNVNDLREAAIAMRDIELAQRNIKGSNRGPADVDTIFKGKPSEGNKQYQDAVSRLNALKQKLGPEKMKQYGETLRKLYDFQDGIVKKYMVETGLMSEAQFKGMKEKNQFYVPFRRVTDKVNEFLGMTPQSRPAGSVGSQNVIKKIKGSDKEIEDPVESIVENVYKIVGLGKRQEVAQNIVNLRTKLPEGMITEVKKPSGANTTVDVFENGKVKHYEAPPEVVEAARGLREQALNNVVKILSIPTAWFRATATGANPEFLAPNVFRDLQSAFVNVGLNPFAFAKGLAHFLNEDEVYQNFLKSGGQTSRVALDRPYLKQTVEDITGQGAKKGFTVKSITDIPKKLFSGLQTLGEFSEQPTRVAMWEKVYNDSIKAGMSDADAMKEAALKAQEGTVNFARRGADTQSFNAIYAFLNARWQGVDQLVRNFKNDPKGVGMRLGMVTVAPAIGLYAWNNRFKSYNDDRVVSESDKRENFIFMLSDTPIDTPIPGWKGIQYIKVPKGDVGKLANPVEAFLDYSFGKGGKVSKTLLETLMAFAPIDNVGDIVPTALKPPVENFVNKSFFTGYDIVPDYKKSYPPGFQDSSYTSPLFRYLGQNLNISPAQLQNLAEGYGTGWVRIAEMLLSKAVPEQYVTDKNNRGAPVNQIPVARRFLGGAHMSEEEKLQSDKAKAEYLKRDIGTIRNAIKNGKIPYDQGMKQIEDLQKKYNDQVGQPAADVKGAVSGRLEQYAQVYSIDKYLKPAPEKGIEKYDFEDQQIATARKLFGGEGDLADFPEELKDEAYKKMGLKKEEVEYDYYANMKVETKSKYILDEIGGKEHDDMISTLISGRVESLSGKMFVTDEVLKDVYDAELITKDEYNELKKMKFDKKGTQKTSASGTGGKSKKTKLKEAYGDLADIFGQMKKMAKTPSLPDIGLKEGERTKKSEAISIEDMFKKPKINESDSRLTTKVPKAAPLPIKQLFAQPKTSYNIDKAKQYVASLRSSSKSAPKGSPIKLSKSFYRVR